MGSRAPTVVAQVRGRFAVHRISADEAKFKLCRIKEVAKGAKGIPYMNTHDGRTIRYPDPQIGAMDTIKLDLETGKVRRGPTLPGRLVGRRCSSLSSLDVALASPLPSRALPRRPLALRRVAAPPALTPRARVLQMTEFVKFETGNLAMVNGGKNTGRIGVIVSRERHQGSFDIVHLKDSAGHSFATRLGNVFVIGEGNRPLVSLPRRKGLKQSILEERAARPPKN